MFCDVNGITETYKRPVDEAFAFSFSTPSIGNSLDFLFQNKMDKTTGTGYYEIAPIREGVFDVQIYLRSGHTSEYNSEELYACISAPSKFLQSNQTEINNGNNLFLDDTDVQIIKASLIGEFDIATIGPDDYTHIISKRIYLSPERVLTIWDTYLDHKYPNNTAEVFGKCKVILNQVLQSGATYSEFFSGHEESTPGYNYYVFPVQFNLSPTPNYNPASFTIQNNSAEILIHESGVYQIDVEFLIPTEASTTSYYCYSIISNPSFFVTNEGMREVDFTDMIANDVCYFKAYNHTPVSKKMYIQSGQVLTFWTYHALGGDFHTLDISIQRVA